MYYGLMAVIIVCVVGLIVSLITGKAILKYFLVHNFENFSCNRGFCLKNESTEHFIVQSDTTCFHYSVNNINLFPDIKSKKCRSYSDNGT